MLSLVDGQPEYGRRPLPPFDVMVGQRSDPATLVRRAGKPFHRRRRLSCSLEYNVVVACGQLVAFHVPTVLVVFMMIDIWACPCAQVGTHLGTLMAGSGPTVTSAHPVLRRRLARPGLRR